MKKLLGVGGSQDSFTALERTLQRVRNTGDEVVVAVVDNPESTLSADEVEDRVRRALEDVELEAEVRRLEGHAGSGLLELAEAEGFDEIVLGGGRRSNMGKIRVGEIAEFVVLNSRVSVKLVR
ncbi:MAG: universal stress protein [Halobacteriota archaeon]